MLLQVDPTTFSLCVMCTEISLVLKLPAGFEVQDNGRLHMEQQKVTRCLLSQEERKKKMKEKKNKQEK